MTFDTCPVCRSALSGEPAQCPSCGANLSIYRDLASRADSLIAAARDWLSRGRSDLAHEVVRRLPQLVASPGPQYHALAARVALAEGRMEEARAHLPLAPEDERAALESLTRESEEHLARAREEYNYALSAARDGRLDLAAQHLELAAALAPSEPRIWQLKLKLDVKRGAWGQCYADLAALDGLGARPAQYAGLEALLPAR